MQWELYPKYHLLLVVYKKCAVLLLPGRKVNYAFSSRCILLISNLLGSFHTFTCLHPLLLCYKIAHLQGSVAQAEMHTQVHESSDLSYVLVRERSV